MKCWWMFLLIGFATSPALSQVQFRQNNTALPPFGGYLPDAGATLRVSTSDRLSFQRGNSAAAIPRFGGYLPGSGATLRVSTGGVAVPQGGLPAGSPLGSLIPGSGSSLSLTGRVQRPRGQMMGRAMTPPAVALANQNSVQQRVEAAQKLRKSRADRGSMRRRRAAQRLMRQAERAEVNGNLAAARTFYRRALQYGVPELSELSKRHLQRLDVVARTAEPAT